MNPLLKKAIQILNNRDDNFENPKDIKRVLEEGLTQDEFAVLREMTFKDLLKTTIGGILDTLE